MLASTLALAAIFWGIFRASGWHASRSAKILLLGLSMLALHNLLDFNLEVAAIGGLTAALLGAFVGAYPPASAPRISFHQQRSFAFLVVACTLAATALAWRKDPEFPLQERNEAHEILKRSLPVDEAPDLSAFRGWMQRYPADPYFPAAAGLLLSRTQPAKALRWFGWAIRRGPNLGIVRLGLAETLGRAGYRQQALLEVRLAMERDPAVLAGGISVAGSLATSLEEILAISPAPPLEQPFLEGLARRLPPRSEIFRELRGQTLQKYPCTSALQESLQRETFAAIEASAAPCDGPAGQESCKRSVEEALSRLKNCPDLQELHERLQADFYWAVGERNRALQALERTCSHTADLAGCLQRLAERAATLPDPERLKRATKLVIARRCQEPSLCAKTWAWASRLFEQAGDLPAALSALEKASEQDPNDPNLRYRQALLSLQMQASERALQILRQLVARFPNFAPARAKLAELQAAPVPLPLRKDRK